jgi:hypothetical protein
MKKLRQLVSRFPLQRPGSIPGQVMKFVVDKEALGQVYSEYFGFPCQFSFCQILLAGAGKIGQLLADIPNGLSLTPPHDIKKIIVMCKLFRKFILKLKSSEITF